MIETTKKLSGWALALTLCLGVAGAQEQGAPAGRLTLKTEKVVVFKDGYALVVKKATGQTDARGRLFTDEVPDAAVLGSFWATPEEGQLLGTRAGWVESRKTITREADCAGTVEVLLANQGKLCRVTLSDKATHAGTIHRVLVRRANQRLSAELAERLGLAEAPSGVRREIEAVSGSQFVLRTQGGDLMLPLSSITSLSIQKMATRWTRRIRETRKAKRLSFRFEQANQPRTLWLMYFRPGLRWIPTYKLELVGDKKKKQARISLQAELLNEAEPLRETKVDLVVGVPNFRFKSIPSPLILERRLRRALVQAAPQVMGTRSQLSNALYTQRSSEFRRRAVERTAEGRSGIQLPGALTAGGKQDLFVYHLKALTLKKGERTALPIFRTTVPYQDVYTWEVHFKHQGQRGGSSSPQKLSTNKTWHQLLLANQTKQPWTTGAAMMLAGGQPLGQDLLTYTSPGDRVRVPVTVAVDVRGTYGESETGRELNAVRYQGSRYAKISKRGTLNLCNHKSEPITVEVTCRFGGKAVKASHDGKVTLGGFDRNDWVYYYGHQGLNNHSDVRWTVELKPGEVVDLTVEYHYFLRY